MSWATLLLIGAILGAVGGVTALVFTIWGAWAIAKRLGIRYLVARGRRS